MITWLQTSMSRHHKWVFSILLVVIIIAFVFTIGNTPTGRMGDSREVDFYGVNINSQRELAGVESDLQWLLYLTGQTNISQQALETLQYDRVALQWVAQQLHFPQVTQEEFTRFITQMPVFMNERGQFDKMAYQSFLDGIHANPRMSRAALDQALANNAQMMQFADVMTGPGYASAQEALMMLQMRQAEYVVHTAKLNAATVPMTLEADLKGPETYFEQQKERYRVPLTIVTQAVVFPAEKYAERVSQEIDEAKLEAFFTANAERYPEKLFADVKTQVREDYRRLFERQEALKAAVDFAREAQDGRIETGSDKWNALVQKYGLQSADVKAFSAGQIPEGYDINANTSSEVVEFLSREDSIGFTEPLSIEKGAVIFVRKEVIESHIPPLEQVREQVAKDYSAFKKNERVSNFAKAAADRIKEGLKEGKTFDELAKDANLKEIIKTEPFTLEKTPETLSGIVRYVLSDMSEGEVRAIPMRDEDPVFIYVEKKTLPEISPDDERVKAMAQRLNFMDARATQVAVMSQMVDTKLDELGMPVRNENVRQAQQR